MKLSTQMPSGIALIATLFSLQTTAAGAIESSSPPPTLRQTPASAVEPLGNMNRKNVPITLASATAIDLQRGSSHLVYGDVQAPQIALEQNPPLADSHRKAAVAAEPAGEIWMFPGGLAIAFLIAWRRCRWASLRSGSAIPSGRRSPPLHPGKQLPSPIGPGAGHGHLPFGG